MSQRDYYQVLGVRPGASEAEIRAAFVRLSKRHHPDAAGGDSNLAWRVQDVQQAYRCLSVHETRAAHDAALAETERQHFARQRIVQRRLHRYDRRHPRAQPRPGRPNPWRTIVLVALGAGALVSLRLIA